MLAAVMWSARRTSENTVKLKAESSINCAELYMIQNMVKLINIADKFKGVPYQETLEEESKFNLIVCCSIMFPNEKACWAFIDAFPNQV